MMPLEGLLPALYRTTPQDQELQRVLMDMIARAERDKDVTIAQLFPSTTGGWGLELWERAWGIPADLTQTDQRRRERILGKVKGTGTTTLEVIRGIAGSFSTYPVKVVEDSALYRLCPQARRTVYFTSAAPLITQVDSTGPCGHPAPPRGAHDFETGGMKCPF